MESCHVCVLQSEVEAGINLWPPPLLFAQAMHSPIVAGAQGHCGFLHSARDAEPVLSIPCSGHTAQTLLAPSKPAHTVPHCSKWPAGPDSVRDVIPVQDMEPVHCFVLQSINLPQEPSGHRRQLIPVS